MENGTPCSRLLRRLDAVVELSEDDRRAVARMPMTVRNLKAGHTIAGEGDRPTQCCLILDGYVSRHKRTRGGRRQIISFHVPGDVVDLQMLHLERLDDSITTLGPVVGAFISHAAIKQALAASPGLTHAFWREVLITGAIVRQWMISLGQRDSLARVAHLICEMAVRLRAVGMARDLCFVIPWTQADLADAAGISTVHTNRVVQELRRLELIEWQGRLIQVRDWNGLQRAADFKPDYLQLRHVVVAPGEGGEAGVVAEAAMRTAQLRR